MGCDIHGFVEVCENSESTPKWWSPYILVGHVVGRSYGAFGCLFGVRNYGGLSPIAERRGLPSDASYTAKEEYKEGEGDYHSASFITYKEIEMIALDAPSTKNDERVHEYSIRTDNTLIEGFKCGRSSSLEDKGVYELLSETDCITDEDNVYALEPLTPREALDCSGFQLLFLLMKTLAKKFGSENVRMVVWFDN